MGRTAKYSEEALLDAVVRYAELHEGKITAIAVAQWANENMDGMEGVQDYHFLRPVSEKNYRTNKMEKRERKCKVRMDEINRTWTVNGSVQRNLLLSASDINQFFDLPVAQQRKQIQDARIQVQKLARDVARLSKENELYRLENLQLQGVKAEIDNLMADIKKEKELRGKQISYLMQHLDEQTRRQLLRDKGFGDGSFDLTQHLQYMDNCQTRLFRFQDIVKNFPIAQTVNSPATSSPEAVEDEITGLIAGIFDELE